MKTVIHVNQHHIKSNGHQFALPLPVFTVKTYKSNIYGNKIIIHGPSKVIYSPVKPLKCGAKVWIETNSKVEVTL